MQEHDHSHLKCGNKEDRRHMTLKGREGGERGRKRTDCKPTKSSIQNCILGRGTVSTSKPQTESSSDIFP